MKLTILAVTSIDGKLTRGNDSKIHSWTSAEDLEHYKKVLASTQVIIMGRRTYKAMNPKPKEGKLLVILTESPADYAKENIKDQLEFTNESAPALVKRLSDSGYSDGIVNGGGYVNGEFMSHDLVDELFVTIEPFAFGEGVELFGGQKLNSELKLISSTKLNERGSLLLHYRRS